MRTIRQAVPLAALLAVLTAGCDGNGETAGQADATFVAVDIDFAEAPGSLPAGEVTIELVNEGGLEHNVTLEGAGADPVVEAAGGQTETGTVTVGAGEYVAYCAVPGHREAGMEATITVDG